MKEAIREYLIPSIDVKKEHWDRAIFVFDTNVLLNLYRYSKKSRDALLDAIVKLEGRHFMPHQVAYEFARRRLQIIYQTSNTDVMKKEINTFLEAIRQTFHLTQDDTEYKLLGKYIHNWIKRWQKENVLVQKHSEDQILNKLLELFDGSTGAAYTDKDYDTHCAEAKKRVEKKLPPGYKDSGKTENQEGDYIVWRQIMDYAKEQGKDVVFVTDDQKEDWWYKVSGEIIGPRPELRKEFYSETKHEINFYAVQGFLEHIGGVSKDVIDEIKSVEELKSSDYIKKEIQKYLLSKKLKTSMTPSYKLSDDFIYKMLSNYNKHIIYNEDIKDDDRIF